MEKKILALFSKKSSLEIHGCRLQSVGGKRWQWQSIYPAFIHSFKNYLVSMCYSLGWVGHIKMNNTKLYSLQTCSLDGRIVISSWTSWSLKSPHSARFFRWKSSTLSLLWEVFWKPDTVSLPYALSVRPRQGTWQKWGDFPWPLLIVLTELTLTGGPSYRGSLEAWESSQGQLVGGTSTWFLLRLLETPQGLTCSVTLYTSLEPPCWQPGPSQGPSLRPRLRPLVDANQPEIRQETHAPLMPILPKPHVNQPLGSIQWVLSLHETQDPKPSTYLVPKAVPVISLPGVSFVPFLGASVLCCWVTVSALYNFTLFPTAFTAVSAWLTQPSGRLASLHRQWNARFFTLDLKWEMIRLPGKALSTVADISTSTKLTVASSEEVSASSEALSYIMLSVLLQPWNKWVAKGIFFPLCSYRFSTRLTMEFSSISFLFSPFSAKEFSANTEKSFFKKTMIKSVWSDVWCWMWFIIALIVKLLKM